MSTQWYVNRNGKQEGPMTGAQLKQLADNKQLQPDDLVWKEGLADWIPARQIKGLFPPGTGTASQTADKPPLTPAVATPTRSVAAPAFEIVEDVASPEPILASTTNPVDSYPYQPTRKQKTGKSFRHTGTQQVTITRMGILSCGKFFACYSALMGLIPGLLLTLLSIIGIAAGAGKDGVLAFLTGFLAVILIPIFSAIGGFITGILSAILYNIIAAIVGGITIELE